MSPEGQRFIEELRDSDTDSVFIADNHVDDDGVENGYESVPDTAVDDELVAEESGATDVTVVVRQGCLLQRHFRRY